MSAIQSAPSGPVLSIVGRNQLSLEARNSRSDSLGPRWPRKVTPSGSSTTRCTRLCTGSLTKRLEANQRPEKLVAIGRRTVGRGDAARHVRVVEPRQRPADGKQPRVGLERLPRVGRGKAGVALEVVIGQHVMPRPVGIVVAEPVPPVVAMPAILRLAALGLELARVRPEPEIAAVDRRQLSRLQRPHPPAAVAVGPVNPAVQAELEAVESMLLVAFD